MRITRTTGRRTSTASALACVIASGSAWQAVADQDLVAEVVQAQAIDIAQVERAEEAAEDDLLLLDATPGFSLNMADPDFRDVIAELNKFIDEAEWAKAFRLLTDLDTTKLQYMVPLGGDGRYVLVKEELQRQLLSLPPEGRRAFRLYFDGQATEQFEAVKNHPLPGSDEQLAMAQELVDRLLASSVGGEAAVLLGDMYFGRGLFDQAERCWGLALEEGSATGQAAVELEAKRALALQRAGQPEKAQTLYTGLSARYENATIQAGGEDVDAIAMLGEMIGQPQAVAPAAADEPASRDLLPQPDAMPIWHYTLLEPSARNAVLNARSQGSWYSPPGDLVKYVPPVTADDKRVYYLWLDVVVAMDRQTGKVVWHDGAMKGSEDVMLATAQTVAGRVQSNHGDPRNYNLAISDETLLVTAPLSQDISSPFIIRAYEAEGGLVKWSSDTRQDWTLQVDDQPQEGATSVLGEVLAHEGWAYAIVHRAGGTGLHLRRFDPLTGEVDWTIFLGNAESISFQYTQVNRLPQPSMLMGPSLLYVMTNNGAVLAVDVIANELKWAMRTEPPFGIGHKQGNVGFRGNQLGNQLNNLANTNGSDRMLLQDGTLYAKEHNGKTLYALDPSTGEVNWSRDGLDPDAKLVGIDDKHFYVMNRAMQSYHIDGERGKDRNNKALGSPEHGGAVLLGDKILLYGSGKLRQLDTTFLDPAGRYDNTDHLGMRGGHLYVFDDLLIAVDTHQIAAFKILDNND